MVTRKLSFFLLISLILFTTCGKKQTVIESFTGFAQGTTYSIVYDNNKKISPVELKQKVEKILGDFDMSLSLYKDSSILSKVNRNEDVLLDTFFTGVFEKSVRISELTNGAFDVTVGSLVKAWGFGPDEHKNISEAKRDSLVKLVGMDKVSIKNSHLIKSVPEINLDFNAIAQGYSVDIICDFLAQLGFQNYLVEIGGEVKAVGTKSGAKWRIGIDRPEDNNMTPGKELEAVIGITDEALATSGNYRKFYVENGIKYSHTIDPRTGYPAKNNLLSATILADGCAEADGIATACMVIGKDSAIKFIEKNPQYRAFFVFSDEIGNFRTWVSPGLMDRISDLEND
jgi:thiamine biosynthesis lipoprotein